MFGLFKKVEPDPQKIGAFCRWFAENQQEIIGSVENSENDREAMFVMLDRVEAQLAAVYRDGYIGQIHFEYGHNPNGKWDLNLYHLNKHFLMRATEQIAQKLNAELGEVWSVNTGK